MIHHARCLTANLLLTFYCSFLRSIQEGIDTKDNSAKNKQINGIKGNVFIFVFVEYAISIENLRKDFETDILQATMKHVSALGGNKHSGLDYNYPFGENHLLSLMELRCNNVKKKLIIACIDQSDKGYIVYSAGEEEFSFMRRIAEG